MGCDKSVRDIRMASREEVITSDKLTKRLRIIRRKRRIKINDLRVQVGMELDWMKRSVE